MLVEGFLLKEHHLLVLVYHADGQLVSRGQGHPSGKAIKFCWPWMSIQSGNTGWPRQWQVQRPLGYPLHFLSERALHVSVQQMPRLQKPHITHLPVSMSRKNWQKILMQIYALPRVVFGCFLALSWDKYSKLKDIFSSVPSPPLPPSVAIAHSWFPCFHGVIRRLNHSALDFFIQFSLLPLLFLALLFILIRIWSFIEPIFFP